MKRIILTSLLIIFTYPSFAQKKVEVKNHYGLGDITIQDYQLKNGVKVGVEHFYSSDGKTVTCTNTWNNGDLTHINAYYTSLSLAGGGLDRGKVRSQAKFDTDIYVNKSINTTKQWSVESDYKILEFESKCDNKGHLIYMKRFDPVSGVLKYYLNRLSKIPLEEKEYLSPNMRSSQMVDEEWEFYQYGEDGKELLHFDFSTVANVDRGDTYYQSATLDTLYKLSTAEWELSNGVLKNRTDSVVVGNAKIKVDSLDVKDVTIYKMDCPIIFWKCWYTAGSYFFRYGFNLDDRICSAEKFISTFKFDVYGEGILADTDYQYKGYLKNETSFGHGTYTKGKVRKEGFFEPGFKLIDGIFVDEDGTVYKGKFEGYGPWSVQWTDASSFDGNYSEKGWKGRMCWNNNGNWIEGLFDNNFPFHSNYASLIKGEHYIANYQGNIMNFQFANYNKLSIEYANGDKYIGPAVLKSDLEMLFRNQTTKMVPFIPNGEGVINYCNGSSYTGHLIEGKFDGNGVFINEVGDKYSGEWNKGSMTGPASIQLKNGNSYNREKGDIGIIISRYSWADGRVCDVKEWLPIENKPKKATFLLPDGSKAKKKDYETWVFDFITEK